MPEAGFLLMYFGQSVEKVVKEWQSPLPNEISTDEYLTCLKGVAISLEWMPLTESQCPGRFPRLEFVNFLEALLLLWIRKMG